MFILGISASDWKFIRAYMTNVCRGPYEPDELEEVLW